MSASANGRPQRAPRRAAKSSKPNPLAGIVNWADERTGLAAMSKTQIRKVFPDHWSFMLGEIALWSFVVLLITGTFLTLWFHPSSAEVTYHGSYDQLRGVKMSDAYASTLHISFDIRGGLLLRQIHHWAANLFIAAMFVHMMRIFFTGAFRKPREINWMIGMTLLMLGILEGFAGYSLPDDLLSGTGLRIADGLVRSIPVVGTYLEFFMFGGQFPGDEIISRLYAVHILLIPGLLVALIGAHMLLLVYQKHTQWPGPGRTNDNVVGYPMLPVYAAKAGGFFFTVFGVSALLGGIMQINPIWMYGPYDPSKVTADSQPDWYMGVPEGLLRAMPGIETHVGGFTISWNVFIPGVVAPGLLFTVMLLYPFLEGWITGDRREHHLLQRPRNAPTRTAFMAAMITLFGVLWAEGGNDVLALVFHLSLNDITWVARFAIFIGPAIAFWVTRRWCISLQRQTHTELLHGYESGVLMRSPEGGYAEKHLPLPIERAYTMTANDRDHVLPMPTEEDENGVANRKVALMRLRARLSRFWYGSAIQKPTREEVEEAHAHAAHELEIHEDGHQHLSEGEYEGDYEYDGTPADGHQYDGRHGIDESKLRQD
ncbi:MAG TPA: ubiquinol-cytochrome c reductase cytochrome b subunit [Nocardioidaceae bacterium]|nr:ubiquinol-cytochrome c reductase cytochrome b subunit [Nocardioidaceae bacterium]